MEVVLENLMESGPSNLPPVAAAAPGISVRILLSVSTTTTAGLFFSKFVVIHNHTS